jgi:hypothetical protein
MKILISDKALDKIYTFYLNVAKKYKYTWSMEDSIMRIDKVSQEAYKVGTELAKRRPGFIRRWIGYSVDYSKATGWYFAYKIEDGVIYVEDAENYRNMYDLENE